SPLRGDEDLALALGAHHGRRHLHVRLLHGLLGSEAEIDLLRQRNGKWIAPDRSPVLAALRLEGRERGLVAAGRGTGEGGRAQRSLAGARLVEAALAGEAPGAVDEHPDADSLALGVAQVVDLPVLRDDVLAPKRDRARVRVRGAGAQRRVHRCLGQRLHVSTLTVATLAPARWWRNW